MADPYIVLVCGGRTYKDQRKVRDVLDGLVPKPSLIVTGGAQGADWLAVDWATLNGIHSASINALWHTHGNGAGPIRNQTMLDVFNVSLVVAFPGGRGTADMVRRAKAAGVRVREVQDG